MKRISMDESGAFIERFTLAPAVSGVLDGLTFAVKDLIDVAGYRTGCGNPDWRKQHPPATVNAVCVEQLLAAGAICSGKTITDEMAFSLLGENHFYGTPLNPRAPDRVPGGSSCGSASATACGLVDFALGTDTGGSVRIPASNCGIYGMRPTHGRISVAGVNPLSPSMDTVGILASSAQTLVRAMSVLLALPVSQPQKPDRVFIIREAFELCDPDVSETMKEPLELIREFFHNKVHEISMREIDQQSESGLLYDWYEIYRVMQRAESESCLGSWVAATNPEFGPLIDESFQLARNLDRNLIKANWELREKYYRLMNSFLGSKDLICIPTAPAYAPLKGSLIKRESSPGGYYARTLSLTSVAGVARLPQTSIPIETPDSPPIGISFIGRSDEDAFLLSVIGSLPGFSFQR